MTRSGSTFTVIGVGRSGIETVVHRGLSRHQAEEARRVLIQAGACTSVIIRPDAQGGNTTFQQSPEVPLRRDPDAANENPGPSG